MNAFFVPQLGSQIYSMAGMTTQLNLQADKPAIYPGLSAQFSGDEFSDMHFDVRAVQRRRTIGNWVAGAKAPASGLDVAAYARACADRATPRRRRPTERSTRRCSAAIVAGTAPDRPGRRRSRTSP